MVKNKRGPTRQQAGRIIQAAGSFHGAGGMSGDGWPGPQAMWDYVKEELRKARGGRDPKTDHEPLIAAVEERARAMYPKRLGATEGARLIESMVPNTYAVRTRRDLAAKGIQRIWAKQQKGFSRK